MAESFRFRLTNDIAVSDLFTTLKDMETEFFGCSVLTVDIPLAGQRAVSHKFTIEDLAEIYLIDSGYWPEMPPLATMNWHDDLGPEILELNWNLRLAPKARLGAAISNYVSRHGPRVLSYGNEIGDAQSVSAEVAEKLGWRRFLMPVSDLCQTLTDQDAQARVEPSVVQALRGSKVTIVGLGSVGSYLAEHLCRSGVQDFVLIDGDAVEAANISRSSFTLKDIGLKKSDATHRILRGINRAVNVRTVSSRFEKVQRKVLREIFEHSDMIIAATDDQNTQLRINRCAFYVDKPSIYVGLYAGAKAGEIFTVVPRLTPCLMCMVGSVREALQQATNDRHTLDYGTGRLTSEIALGCDIHHVSTAAIKLSISLLAALKWQEETPVGKVALDALRRQLSLAILCMEPDHWFFPDLLSGVAGQYAFNSAWFSGRHDPICPVCSSTPTEDPFAGIDSDVDVDSVRRQLGL